MKSAVSCFHLNWGISLWNVSDSLVRIDTFLTLGIDRGRYIVIRISTLYRQVVVVGGGNQAGIKLGVRPVGSCGTVGVITDNSLGYAGRPRQRYQRL